MNKVYLLLRNNHQTGPHSLEELVQIGLKPLDLVWIEGKSFSWSYPAEIGVLKPYVVQSNEAAPNEPAATKSSVVSTASPATVHQAYMPPGKETSTQSAALSAKKIYVSMPSNRAQQQAAEPQISPATILEQKAEELRKRTQAYASGNKLNNPPIKPNAGTPIETFNKEAAPINKPVTTGDAVKVKYARPVGELEEEYSSWVYNQKSIKKKNFSWGGIAAAIAVVILLGAAFSMSKYDSSENEPVPQNEPATQELTAKDTQNTEDLVPAPYEQTATLPKTSGNESFPSTAANPEKRDNTSFASNTSSTPGLKKEAHTSTKAVTVKESPTISSNATAKEEKNTISPVENNSKIAVKTKEETNKASAETPEKKKTFGAAISGFFNKFKRKVDVIQNPEDSKQESKPAKQPVEKPQSTAQEPGTERKAKRRGDDETKPAEAASNGATAEKTNFDDLVDITSNEPAEKWMLGVHGLKLTIRNRSTETLRTAAVEVRYYSEQNELLEKKVLHFTNVPPSKSATLPVPDHRLADHTEYRFLSSDD